MVRRKSYLPMSKLLVFWGWTDKQSRLHCSACRKGRNHAPNSNAKQRALHHISFAAARERRQPAFPQCRQPDGRVAGRPRVRFTEQVTEPVTEQGGRDSQPADDGGHGVRTDIWSGRGSGSAGGGVSVCRS